MLRFPLLFLALNGLVRGCISARRSENLDFNVHIRRSGLQFSSCWFVQHRQADRFTFAEIPANGVPLSLQWEHEAFRFQNPKSQDVFPCSYTLQHISPQHRQHSGIESPDSQKPAADIPDCLFKQIPITMHIRRMPSPTLKQRDNGAALAITTTFIPPPQCTQGQLTMLGRQEFFVWQNEPVPVDGITVSSCYPPPFMTSYLASLAGTSLGAFSSLVCPQNYHTHSSQDLGGDTPYIVCCPSNYLFHPAATPDPNRPGAGGTCYSDIISTTVSKYDENTYSGLIFFSTSGQAYAHPLDGFAFEGQHAATTSQATVAPITTSSSVVSQSPSAAAVTAAAITTSGSSPTTSESAPTVSTRNTLPQSSSSQTLSPISVSTIPSSVIPLSTQGSTTIWSTVQPSVVTIYTSGPNGTSSATPQPSTGSSSLPVQSSALNGGQKAGIAIGAILGALLLGAVAFFLLKRRRARDAPAEVSHSPPYTSEKPSLLDHPSTRSYPNEKQLYKSASATEYHELSSPQMETHELGAGADGDRNAARELEATPSQKAGQELRNSTQVSTPSPSEV